MVPAGDALGEALRWAERIAAMAPAAVRAGKELLLAGTWLSPEEARTMGLAQAAALMQMRDTIEGGMAFAERRAPAYEDR